MMQAGLVDHVVLPGDVLGTVHHDVELKLGPGIRREQDKIIASKCGIVRLRKPNIYWIDINQRRYVPVVKERVIGIVTGKPGDNIRVDIGCSQQAILSYLAFEGATKRNRPNVQVGDLLYCEVSVANKDMEPELVCVDGSGKASGMGVLSNDGFMFRCSLGLAQKLLANDCPVLKLLSRFPFEIAVGLNGCVWIKSGTINNTILISNAVENSEFLSIRELENTIEQLVQAS